MANFLTGLLVIVASLAVCAAYIFGCMWILTYIFGPKGASLTPVCFALPFAILLFYEPIAELGARLRAR